MTSKLFFIHPVYQSDTTYVIHPIEETCPTTVAVVGGEGGQGSDAAFQAHLLEELQDFPWGKKAARLLNYLRLKEVIGPDTDHLDGIPLIDVLRYVSTSDPPPSSPGQVARQRRPQQEKILRVLRKLKLVRGLQIPAAYLPNKSAAAVFWKGG